MPRQKQPDSEKKVGVAAKVDPALAAWFERHARADERTVSFIIERAMREYRERRESAAPPRSRR